MAPFNACVGPQGYCKEPFSTAQSYKLHRTPRLSGSFHSLDVARRLKQKNTEQNKLVPEGIEGITSYKGKVSDVIYQLLGGLHSGLGYCGAHNLNELKEKAVFIQVTNNGLIEGHPHDINIVKDAPNYQKR